MTMFTISVLRSIGLWQTSPMHTTEILCCQTGPAELATYTGPVYVPAGSTFVSDPLFFGPTGTVFPEPGIQMVFVSDPASLVMPDGLQMLPFKVRWQSLDHICPLAPFILALCICACFVVIEI
jgi:hypothetical protein